jgi:serine/threonine protein kinase
MAVDLVMEFMDCDLYSYEMDCRTDGLQIEPLMVQHIFKSVLSGLRCMHSKNILHRDIKPRKATLIQKTFC